MVSSRHATALFTTSASSLSFPVYGITGGVVGGGVVVVVVFVVVVVVVVVVVFLSVVLRGVVGNGFEVVVRRVVVGCGILVLGDWVGRNVVVWLENITCSSETTQK